MFKKKAKSLSELIRGSGSPLGQLAEEARLRTDLGAVLRKGLPADVAEGLLHCNIRPDNTVVLVASSPEWAARLRFEAETVRELCRQNSTVIERVVVRVATD